MNLLSIITVVSLVMAFSTWIVTILMYLRYASVFRGALMAVKAGKTGEIEIVDLLNYPVNCLDNSTSGYLPKTVMP